MRSEPMKQAPLAVPVVGAALATAAAAVAATPGNGTYAGKTAQESSITISVNSKQVKEAKFGIDTPGLFCAFEQKDLRPNATISKKGRFSFTGSRGQTVVKGHFGTAKTASGTIRFRFRSTFSGQECDSGNVKFHVKRK
jgi:hypothetical protein